MTAAAILARSSAVRPFLSAEWRYLAMVNFAVDPAVLEPFVPSGTRLDFFHGETFLSLVGFQFRDTRVLGFAIPGHRDFEELNLRFYVVRDAADGPRRGVVFIRELAPRWCVCTVANVLYNENYQCVPMRSHVRGFHANGEEDSACISKDVTYEWEAADRWHSLHMNVRGSADPFVSGSHEEFIVEHYWGYCRQRNGGTIEYEVRHPPWRLWREGTAAIDADFMPVYGESLGKVLARPPVSAFVAEGSTVTVSRPHRISS